MRRHLPQIIMAVTAPATLFLAYLHQPWQSWAPLVGLIGQPFWLTTTARARQWGMFVVAVVYTGVHLQAAWRFWLA